MEALNDSTEKLYIAAMVNKAFKEYSSAERDIVTEIISCGQSAVRGINSILCIYIIYIYIYSECAY